MAKTLAIFLLSLAFSSAVSIPEYPESRFSPLRLTQGIRKHPSFDQTTFTTTFTTTTNRPTEPLPLVKEKDEVSDVVIPEDGSVLVNSDSGLVEQQQADAPVNIEPQPAVPPEHYAAVPSDLKPAASDPDDVSFKSPINPVKNASIPIDSIPFVPPGSNSTSSSPYLLFDPLGLKIFFFSRSILANNTDGIIFIPSDRESIDSVLKGRFNPKLPTRILIHGGFPGTPQLSWMYEVKDRMLNDTFSEGDSNIFIVEWVRGASISLVDQQLINARMVGYQLGHFLLMARELVGLNTEKVHVITHSIAAFSAHEISRYVNLGRITALDPGGPSFHLLPVDSRLNPLSAYFVDAIHTDAGNATKGDLGKGTSIAVGHVDFYPNGGEEQPGCGLRRLEEIFNPLPILSSPLTQGPLSTSLRQSVSHAIQRLLQPCHHFRAIDYFLESLHPPLLYQPSEVTNGTNNDTSAIVKRHYVHPLIGRNDYFKCRLIAYECSCYEDFLKGVCNGEPLSPHSKSVELGFYSLNSTENLSGIPEHPIPVDGSRSLTENGYYLITKARKPFCLYHYFLKVNFGNWTTSRGVGVAGRGGALYLMVYGTRGSFETRLLGGPEGFRAGSFSSVVATHETDIGPLSHITVAWLPPPTLNLFIDIPFYLKNVEYWPMTVQSAPARQTLSRVLCPVSGSKPAVNSTGHPTIRISPFYRYSFFSNMTGCVI